MVRTVEPLAELRGEPPSSCIRERGMPAGSTAAQFSSLQLNLASIYNLQLDVPGQYSHIFWHS